jgi:acetolactate synthase-1/2/3 large subunit
MLLKAEHPLVISGGCGWLPEAAQALQCFAENRALPVANAFRLQDTFAAAITTGRLAFTIAGDGDFLMSGQELATAVQYGAKTLIVVLNNGMFGTVRMHQEREYPQRVTGTQLRNPDFSALAQAHGYAGIRVTRTEAFEPVLLAALDRPQGTRIEVMLDAPLTSTRGTLADITKAALAREADRR